MRSSIFELGEPDRAIDRAPISIDRSTTPWQPDYPLIASSLPEFRAPGISVPPIREDIWGSPPAFGVPHIQSDLLVRVADPPPQTGGNYDPPVNPNVPWRARPGVAPGFRPPPGEQPPGGQPPPGGEVDPNRNGNQEPGPVWVRPGQPGQPGGQPGRPGAPARTPEDERFERIGVMIDRALTPHNRQGFQGNMIVGGVTGIITGGPLPWMLNRTADTLLNAPATLEPRGPLFAEGSWGRRYVPQTVTNVLEGARNGLDRLRLGTAAPEGSFRYNAARWWKDNFDPRTQAGRELVRVETHFGQLSGQVEALVQADRGAVGNIWREAGIANPATVGAGELGRLNAAQTQQLAHLQSRIERLSNEGWLAARTAPEQLEIARNSGLFQQQELALLERRNAALVQQAELRGFATARQAGTFWGGRNGMTSNFVRGAALVGATMVADHYLDRIFNRYEHNQGLGGSDATAGIPGDGWRPSAIHTNTALIPLALGFMDPRRPRDWAIMGGTLVAGHFLDRALTDYVLPRGTAETYGTIFHENGVDAALLTSAVMLTANAPWRIKAIAIPGAWALGRVYNLVHDPAARNNRQISENAWDLLRTDARDRSANSMRRATDRFVELGRDTGAGEPALRYYWEDWTRPRRQYDDALSAHRGAIIIGTAFGESRLSHGTLIQNIQPRGPQTFGQMFERPAPPGRAYLMEGRDLDFGGQALRALIVARVSVDRARATATQLNGTDVGRGSINASRDNSELDAAAQRIDRVINDRIYGSHNMQACLQELVQFYQQHPFEYAQFERNLENDIDRNRRTPNRQFLAKLMRDLALLKLASATFKMQGADAMGAAAQFNGGEDGRQFRLPDGSIRGYDGAWETLQFARFLTNDANNSDIRQLEQIANDLAGRIPGAVRRQLANPVYNPLNVGDTVRTNR